MPRQEFTDIDRKLGERIRTARLLKNKTQTDLGEAIDMTFQQIQKYERGTNHITVPVLLKIARALETPLEYFVGDSEGTVPALSPVQADIVRAAGQLSEAVQMHIRDFLQNLTKEPSIGQR